jgi:hypothetical protein
MYRIFAFSTAKMVTRTCHSVTLYVCCLSWSVNYFNFFQYILYCTRYIVKLTGTILHIIMCILTHSWCCALNCMLSACSPDSTKGPRTAVMVAQACCRPWSLSMRGECIRRVPQPLLLTSSRRFSQYLSFITAWLNNVWFCQSVRGVR